MPRNCRIQCASCENCCSSHIRIWRMCLFGITQTEWLQRARLVHLQYYTQVHTNLHIRNQPEKHQCLTVWSIGWFYEVPFTHLIPGRHSDGGGLWMHLARSRWCIVYVWAKIGNKTGKRASGRGLPLFRLPTCYNHFQSVFIFISFTIFDVWIFIWWSRVVILLWSYFGDLTLSCGTFNEGLSVRTAWYYYTLFERSRNVHLKAHKRKPTRKCCQLFAKFLF